VKRLESEYAIVLTGTPLENRLEELHSIIEFVDRDVDAKGAGDRARVEAEDAAEA